MKFSTREDIEAPIDYVFARVSDFDGFERRAQRQGAQIIRHKDGPLAVGHIWDIAFTYRGRDRKMQATMVKLDDPDGFEVHGESDGISAVTVVDLVALSRGRTRLAVSVDLRAKSLAARVLLQSLKLAKVKLTKRFKARVLDYSEDIADDYRKSA